MIKLRRRLLATAAVGLALVVSAVLIASMDGDDKPNITTNPPPAADEEPQDTQVDPTQEADETPPPADDDQSDEQADPDEEPELPADDEDGPDKEGKAHGLQTAIQAHIKNMEKAEMKGKSAPPGLQNSLQLLTELYAGVLAGEKATGNANGH